MRHFCRRRRQRGNFSKDPWVACAGSETLAGEGVTAVLEDGALFERGGVALSDVRGAKLAAGGERAQSASGGPRLSGPWASRW